jgi:spore coat protein CotH
MKYRRFLLVASITTLCGAIVWSQQPDEGARGARPLGNFGPENFGPGGGPPGMPGGGAERKLLDEYDTNEDGWLNSTERAEARKFVKDNPTPHRGPGGGRGGFGPPQGFGPPGFGPPGFGSPGFGPPGFDPARGPGEAGPPPGENSPDANDGGRPPRDGEARGGDARGGDGRGGDGRGGRRGFGPPGMGGNRPAASQRKKIDKASVAAIEGDLYDPAILRTVFIDFENADWEAELEDFHGSDVDVPATLTVDGKTYENCGIHFRGMSSYGMVPAGYKRSLNVSIDLADEEQRLYGYKTLNLLNGSGDESMMSTVLYAHIAHQHKIPAPKANFVRVVIDGEFWGIYTNVQQFNKEFLKENFGSDSGARWKVSGSPAGGGGLEYRGDDPQAYEHPYEQKSGGKKAVEKLINLCRVLNQTPTESLPEALEPIVDIDGLLWFLAIDNAVINSDGYWVRASDYSIFLDKEDKFHFIPHDMNEAFRGAGGPGGPGGPGGGRGGRGPGGFGGPGFGGPGFGGPGFGGPGGFDPGQGRPDDRRPRGEQTEDRGPRGGDQPRPERSGSPVELDPLIGLNDASKPLRSKVLAVPEYRERYLQNVRQIATESLNWSELGPFIEQQAALIGEDIKQETRRLGTHEAFLAAVSEKPAAPAAEPHTGPRGGHGAMNLKEFIDGRQAYLLKATEPTK